MNIHWKYWCWIWSSNTLATWYEEPAHLKRPWFGERLRAIGEVWFRRWDASTVSLTQRTWIWAISGRWWRTGNPDVLQSMGSQRVRYNWTTTNFSYKKMGSKYWAAASIITNIILYCRQILNTLKGLVKNRTRLRNM